MNITIQVTPQQSLNCLEIAATDNNTRRMVCFHLSHNSIDNAMDSLALIGTQIDHAFRALGCRMLQAGQTEPQTI